MLSDGERQRRADRQADCIGDGVGPDVKATSYVWIV